MGAGLAVGIGGLAAVGCTRTRTSPLDAAMPARVRGRDFVLRYADGTEEAAFLDGVNIGAAKAGSFPGEFAITKEEYLRWFALISAMNVQVIRVYVNQMPAFYDALAQFNASTDRPLYLLHGAYCNEDMIEEYLDAFGGDGAFKDVFFADIENAVDMVHGNAEVAPRPGNASGTYTSDVSAWTIGWILGIEWTADFVLGTNAANPQRTSFSGTYVRTEDASPFEVFLAEAAELCIARETEAYGTQRPVAICNWCTTDPLDHPNEPSPEMEDAVPVDTEHLRATDAFAAGFFASYHVYPYYPEFIFYDSRYVAGGQDPYLAYLKDLVAYHSQPVLISEYGIPSSRGIAHRNPVTGMSQGHANEARQAEWLMAMNRDIRAAGCVGGLIFTWQDEWFKRTWNSMDYESASRRPFWYNAQSPEECFGLLAFTTGSNITLDGTDAAWKGVKPLAEHEGLSLYASHDAGYLYLLVRGEGVDFEHDALCVPIQVSPGQGSHKGAGLTFDVDVQFLLQICGCDATRVLVDAHYDAFAYSYGHMNAFFDAIPGQYEAESGSFGPVWLAMNRPMLLPESGERTEFERFETGLLACGTADPASAEYDSLADFCIGDGFVEIRLPWMLIGFMDPSTKRAMGNLYTPGGIPEAAVDGVRLGICRATSTSVVPTALYSWDNWDVPETKERLKASYDLLQDYFAGN